MSRNEHNKVKKDWEKFGYKIPNNSKDALLLDKDWFQINMSTISTRALIWGQHKTDMRLSQPNL